MQTIPVRVTFPISNHLPWEIPSQENSPFTVPLPSFIIKIYESMFEDGLWKDL